MMHRFVALLVLTIFYGGLTLYMIVGAVASVARLQFGAAAFFALTAGVGTWLTVARLSALRKEYRDWRDSANAARLARRS